jgi:hypothetical protein
MQLLYKNCVNNISLILIVLVPDFVGLNFKWMMDDEVGFVMSWDERALASSMAARYM